MKSVICGLAALCLLSAPAAAEDYGPPAPKAQPSASAADDAAFAVQARLDRVRKDATRWEIAFQVLNAVDTIQTIDCLQRNICTEANPLFGKNPSAGKLIAAKGAVAVVHWLMFAKLRKDKPYLARTAARISVVLQGSVVAANARFTF